MYIDNCLKKLILHLKKENIYHETLILITADHGSDYAESPRKKLPTGERTYYEHIDIPLIVSKKIGRNIRKNICDTMGVTATFLDILKVPFDTSYKGQSILRNGKDFIISENAGSGNADLIRKDLYFTITTTEYKLMSCLSGNKLIINKLFNIIKDPYELHNLYANNNCSLYKKIARNLAMKLFLERKNIFKIRGITKLNDCL